MALACLGLSHRTAPVDVRERHAFPRARASEALIALRDYEEIHESALLSTCNRVEIYAELDEFDIGVRQLKQFLVNFRHAALGYDIEPYLYTLSGNDAVRHLLRVATGLDSMLIGEPEILGQVKDAYLLAQEAGSLGKSLHKLFRHALSAGKAARSQTAIGSASLSIATAAIELARTHVGSLHGKRVLIVGAGKMGATAAKRLKTMGADIMLMSRTEDRANDVVERLGAGEAIALPSLTDALAQADILLSSTGAPHFVVGPAQVRPAMAQRPERPLFIVDIAVPRDVDPEVAFIPGVEVADIDQLGAAIETTLGARREAIPAVEEIIEEHVSQYAHWYAMRSAEPVISSLMQRAELIREAELARLFARCPKLGERERMLVTGASLTMLSKLLHPAFAKMQSAVPLQDGALERYVRALDELFTLGESGAQSEEDAEFLSPDLQQG